MSDGGELGRVAITILAPLLGLSEHVVVVVERLGARAGKDGAQTARRGRPGLKQ